MDKDQDQDHKGPQGTRVRAATHAPTDNPMSREGEREIAGAVRSLPSAQYTKLFPHALQSFLLRDGSYQGLIGLITVVTGSAHAGLTQDSV